MAATRARPARSPSGNINRASGRNVAIDNGHAYEMATTQRRVGPSRPQT
jgi:hypothetical protein